MVGRKETVQVVERNYVTTLRLRGCCGKNLALVYEYAWHMLQRHYEKQEKGQSEPL